MQVSFVRRTSWPPGMVRHCTDVRHPFIYHDAPSVRNSDSPFKNIYAYLRQNYDAPFHENDRPMTHIILRTPEWRSYWRTLWRTHGKVTDHKTHIWVSVVTNLLLPWWYYASSIWQYMTHPWRTIPGGQEVRLTNDTCINSATKFGHSFSVIYWRFFLFGWMTNKTYHRTRHLPFYQISRTCNWENNQLVKSFFAWNHVQDIAIERFLLRSKLDVLHSL